MPVKWNDKADARLLVGILSTSTPKIDYSKLAEFMGPGCSEWAIRHRIHRLREQVNSMADTPISNSTKSGETSTPTTPRKRAGDATSSVKKSSSKKVKVEDCDEEDS